MKNEALIIRTSFPKALPPGVHMIQYGEEALQEIKAELLSLPIIEKGKKRYYNAPASFDTETSSFYDETDGEESAVCYVWMFGVNDVVVYGRDLDDFKTLIISVDRFIDAVLTVFVHFLKFDFSFIKYYFEWDDVFVYGPREPLYARWSNIEFRDSLVLSGGQSLANIGKNLRRSFLKAVGDLNYDCIRVPETPLTAQELHYCEMDIRVLNEYIREKIEDDGSILEIPYTNTGYVRNYVRGQCFKQRGKYMDFIDNLTLTPDAYLQCERAFAGGAVGPNIRYADKIIENVHSYDIKSSYPYIMVCGYFPMSYPMPLKPQEVKEHFQEYLHKFCCLFTLEIFGLWPKTDYCFPISESKCNEVVAARTASGRVLSAAYVSINVTELDYFIIDRFYDLSKADEVRIKRMRVFQKGYLPKPIVESVIKFFYDKTTLDGVIGKEREYMISKNMLNAIYGMMVEKPVRPELFYQSDFGKGKPDYERQIIEYNEKRNRFLYYPWGVWVTAGARYRLYDAIYNIGDDWRYCDTDSVKFIGDYAKYFEVKNEQAKQNMLKLAKRLKVSPDRVIPTAPNGEKKLLGAWEHEYDARTFKTIGAKRYLVDYSWTAKRGPMPEGSLELTVSGSNKTSTLDYIKQQSLIIRDSPFNVFDSDLYVPPYYAKRTVSTFIDGERQGWVEDWTGKRYWYDSLSGVHVVPTSYTFSMTDEMIDAIMYLTHDGHYTQGEI